MFITENIKKLKDVGVNLKTKSGKVISGLGKNKKKPTSKEILKDIEKNHNHSWYEELYTRNKNNLDDVAIFYRGYNVSYRKMFDNMQKYAKSLKKLGIKSGSEVPICMSNTPEFLYLLGAISIVGAKANIFGPKFDSDYIVDIINGTNSDVIFIDDNVYPKLSNAIDKSNVKKIVMNSFRNSLKNDYDPYEYFDSSTGLFDETVSKYRDNCKFFSIDDFLKIGDNYKGEIYENGNLDSDFTITYTSGSTNTSKPKAMIHPNRSFITIARYHDKDLNGGTNMKKFRIQAHIPTYSNTNLVSSISDALMQGSVLCLEPVYDKNFFANSLLINKPNYIVATTSFWVQGMKKFMYDEEYKNIKLPFLLIPFAVGEGLSLGEERFLNDSLRKLNIGQKFTKIPVPFISMSSAGGDCEHGGLFYTLFREIKNKKPYNLLNKQEEGLGTFDMVECAILDENGNICPNNVLGRLVANSPCTMKGYKNNPEATEKFFIKDSNGKVWADCNVYAYIDDNKKIHLKGRIPNDKYELPLFKLNEEVECDYVNVLSSSVVCVPYENSDMYVIHLEFQPNRKDSRTKVIFKALERIRSKYGNNIADKVVFNIHSNKDSMPLNGSGKRNLKALEKNGLKDCVIPVIIGNKVKIKKFDDNKNKVLSK